MLSPDLSIGMTCSWMERETPLRADTLKRRQPDMSTRGFDEIEILLAPTKPIYMLALCSGVGAVDGDAYLTTLLGYISATYLAELDIHTDISGFLGSLPTDIAKDLGIVLVQMVVLSARHGLCKEPGRIVIAISRSPRRVRIRVSNNGIGVIDPLEPRQRNIFRLLDILASPLSAKVSVHCHPQLSPSICLTTGPLG